MICSNLRCFGVALKVKYERQCRGLCEMESPRQCLRMQEAIFRALSEYSLASVQEDRVGGPPCVESRNIRALCS